MQPQDKAKEPRGARGKANPLERRHPWRVPWSLRRLVTPDCNVVRAPKLPPQSDTFLNAAQQESVTWLILLGKPDGKPGVAA
jgi:hypothetical protein